MSPIENSIATAILDQAFKVHRELGPGLLESVYEKCLQYELIQAGYKVVSQVPIPLTYKEMVFDTAYRADLIVNDLVIVEIKAVEELTPLHFAQTLTYLKVSKLKLGLLINFNIPLLKDGIHRIVNNL